MAGRHRADVCGGENVLTNADMTLYRWNGSGYDRKVIEGVFWEGSKISNTEKTGMVNADSVSIYVPYENVPDLQITTGKDLVIQCVQTFELDNTSEATISASVKQLKKEYEVYTVCACDPKLYGSEELWHYELSCK